MYNNNTVTKETTVCPNRSFRPEKHGFLGNSIYSRKCKVGCQCLMTKKNSYNNAANTLYVYAILPYILLLASFLLNPLRHVHWQIYNHMTLSFTAHLCTVGHGVSFIKYDNLEWGARTPAVCVW